MKKMLPWLITILLAITLIILAAFLLYRTFIADTDKTPVQNAVDQVEAKKLSANEIVEVTSEITEIKTNLGDPDYIVMISFAFQLDKKKTKENFDKIKDINIKPIIIKTLADMKPEELTGANGKDQLSAKLVNLINKTLPDGKLVKIDVTDFIMSSI